MLERGEALDAFWGLFLTHRRRLWEYALSFTKDEMLADELLGVAMVKAAAGYGTYRGGGFKAWMWAIIRNVYIDMHNKDKREILCPFGPFNEHSGPFWEVAEAWLIISDVMGELTDKQRTVLSMRAQGYKHREIAARLGVPLTTVKSLLWRARRNVAAGMS